MLFLSAVFVLVNLLTDLAYAKADPRVSYDRRTRSPHVTFDEYQEAALRTVNPALDDRDRLLDASAGLAEEAGEVLGLVRKRCLSAARDGSVASQGGVGRRAVVSGGDGEVAGTLIG